ncbi:Spy/CpxP family protein refolding chaperone [Thiohalomonas denitrificans]|uniref:Heavy-metal resistance n=1 Tax=Thiohalomonas denitrificans TaxID=415747 RepID=A0A1G5QIM0_9GAMM|nr:Spy/CpxP family protein refolding chaperone [Thiohalomonas denitrificans]SCZ61673.1 Heavy-metal resistance [Thiohalomonas denitrificans]
MKQRNLWALALSGLMGVLAVTGASAQQPQQQRPGPGMMQGQGAGPAMRGGPGMMQGGPGMGPGMMGPGMMQGYGYGTGIWSLNLTDQQRQQLGEIMQQQQKQQWERRSQMQEAMNQLNQLYAKETPDAEKVGEVYTRMGKIQREIAESQVRAHNRMWELLTEEQRQQLRGQGWRGQP